MQRSLYLRPVGPFAVAPEPAGDDTIHGAGYWRGLPLAGCGLAFAAIEIIERHGRAAKRRITALSDMFERDWARDTLPAADMLEALSASRPRLCGLSLDRPRIMGILNVTPDSFSDGGKHNSVEHAIAHGLAMVEAGADILDIGGESTRPGADAVALEVELARVLPVIEGLRSHTQALLSIDTRKAAVMAKACQAGADIINDVSALSHDPDALEAAVETGCPVVLMHSAGDPKTMNDDPRYDAVVLDVFDALERRIAACEAAGIPRAKLVVDPGIGFAKNLAHNVAVLSALSLYHGLGVPVMLGASRKKLIGQLSPVALAPAPTQRRDVPEAADRLPGSLAAALYGVANGVQIVRVHDVAATKQAIAVWQAMTRGAESLGG